MTTIKPDQAVEAITPDLLFRLLGAAHAVTERLEGALRALGLTSATFDLLSELVNANRPLELEDLMTRVSDEPSGVGHLIEGLEQDGFVRRMPHGAAESGVRVVITARGRGSRLGLRSWVRCARSSGRRWSGSTPQPWNGPSQP